MEYVYDLSNIARAIEKALQPILPDWIVFLIMSLIGIVTLLVWLVPTLMALTYFERRGLGFFQIRQGPNRVGPKGILQPIADAIKVLTKESITPAAADPWVFNIAPVLAFSPVLLAFAVIAFAPGMVIADLDIGILFIIAVTSFESLGLFLAGWSSNNKYSLLGAMRAVAALISYEVPLVLSVLGLVMLLGTLKLSAIAAVPVPLILVQPIAFVIFFIGASAEMNRAPLDLMEAESEIVAGFFTEYSGFKFAIFYLAEFASLLVTGGVIASLFLGGFNWPILPPWLWFFAKMLFVYFLFLWTRATLPRIRIDQIMALAWKVLLPVSLVNILLTGVGMLIGGIGTPGGMIAVAVLNWVAIAIFLVALSGKKSPESVRLVPMPKIG